MLKSATLKEAMEVWSKPERLAFATSVDSSGEAQVTTVGWFTRASFRPPTLALAVSRERRLYRCIQESNEFVLAIPGEDQAREILFCGAPSSKQTDRFKECRFITKPGNLVKAPLIENCLANFECRVINQVDAGDHTIFVGEVVSSWMHESPTANLMLVGLESGYKVLAEEGPYRVGVVRHHD